MLLKEITDIPFLTDKKNGQEEVLRLCGDQERSDIYYSVGCDSSDVPFEREDCYCKGDLCNGSGTMMFSMITIFLGLIASTRFS